MALVSVIIPTHNRARLLPAAVASALNQSFRDLEIIVVDDASTDGTTDVRRQFLDSRLRWLRHESPRGGAAARNSGIVQCRGEYVAFLDDDDEWHPDKLARQMEVFAKNADKSAAVYTGYVVIDAVTGRIIGRKTPAKRGDLYPDLLAGNCIGGTSCMVLKRACLDRIGLFDERLPSFQDYDLWMRISREFQFDYVADPLVKYFVHPKKIWTDSDALLRGLEIMLEKYGRSPTFRKYCSRLYLSVGVKLCETHHMEEGRKAISTAIALNSYRLQPYLYFCLSLGGVATFLAARNTLARMHGWMRRRNY
jgi:glycosyltransferase involved in cell wall biosynthesis